MKNKNIFSKVITKEKGIFKRPYLLFFILGFVAMFLFFSCDFGLVDTISAEEFYNKKGTTILTSEKMSKDLLACMDNNENIYIANGEKLFLLDTDSNSFSKMHSFTDEIETIEYHLDKIYIAEGSHVWAYDIASGVYDLVIAMAKPILNLYLANDYFICSTDDGWSSLCYYHLIRISDYQEVDSMSSENISKSYVYSSSQNRILAFDYRYRPTEINYIEIDETSGILFRYGYNSNSYYNSYNSYYSYLGHPLKLFPDESKVLTKYGNIFNTSDLSFSYDAGFEYTDLAFVGNFIYAINENGLTKYEATVPYSQVAILDTYNNRTPVKIFSGTNCFYILSLVESKYLTMDKMEL